MKIAITTSGKDMDAQVDSRFGRAPAFIIADTENNDFSVIDNIQNLNAAQGAGIQSAQNVADSGAEAVITGHVGPKAFRTLSQAGVKIYLRESGSVREAIAALKNGELKTVDNADVEGHW